MDTVDDLSRLSRLKPTIGKTLRKVQGLVFCEKDSEIFCNEEQDLNNLSIEAIKLDFKGLESCKIFCGSDGSSICVDNADLEALNMNEYGEAKVCELSSTKAWAKLINKNIVKVDLIKSEVEECIFAIQFSFESSLRIVIANFGDNLVCREQIHEAIIAEERATFISLN